MHIKNGLLVLHCLIRQLSARKLVKSHHEVLSECTLVIQRTSTNKFRSRGVNVVLVAAIKCNLRFLVNLMSNANKRGSVNILLPRCTHSFQDQQQLGVGVIINHGLSHIILDVVGNVLSLVNDRLRFISFIHKTVKLLQAISNVIL